MGTVHHETAMAKLERLATTLKPGNLASELDIIAPGWRANAGGVNGYGTDQNHHWRIAMARALHDAMPEQFSAIPFNWEQQHGFTTVMAYGNNAARGEQELVDWLDAAIARNAVIMKD
jgi:hypothetical protein